MALKTCEIRSKWHLYLLKKLQKIAQRLGATLLHSHSFRRLRRPSEIRLSDITIEQGRSHGGTGGATAPSKFHFSPLK